LKVIGAHDELCSAAQPESDMKNPTDRDDPRPRTRRSLARWLTLALLALVCAVAAVPSEAQPQPMQGDAAAVDPPSRAARLGDVSGQVWLYNSDSNEWAGVSRNQPLTSGDRIATDNDGRAEITLGTTVLRLDAATEIEIVLLDDARFVVRLQGGSVAARLRNAQALAEFELASDEGRFRVQAVGRYRFDRAEQTSDVTVYNGRAIYENGNTALPVAAGQHAQFWLDAVGAGTRAQPVRDDSSLERGAHRAGPASRPVVSPEMTGAEDLDRYGQWQQTPDTARSGADGRTGRRCRTRRPLGLGAAVGLDLGRRPALGLRAVPLRPLGLSPQRLVLGARHLRRPAGLRAGAGGLGWRSARRRLDHGRRRRDSGLVPARAARGLRAELPCQPALRARGQRHPRHQRDDDHGHRQQPPRRSRSA
jgi:hypothetical protein